MTTQTEIGQKVAEFLRNEQRSMPGDFAPDVWVLDGKLCMQAWNDPDGKIAGSFALAFELTDSPSRNGKLMHALRESLWQASEAARLGDKDRLRNAGMLELSRHQDH